MKQIQYPISNQNKTKQLRISSIVYHLSSIVYLLPVVRRPLFGRSTLYFTTSLPTQQSVFFFVFFVSLFLAGIYIYIFFYFYSTLPICLPTYILDFFIFCFIYLWYLYHRHLQLLSRYLSISLSSLFLVTELS